MWVRLCSAIAGAALVCGCEPGVFRTDVKGSTTITGSPLGGALDLFPAIGSFASIDFSQNQDFQNQGVTKEMINSVRVEVLTLKIIDPSTQDFSFLDNLEFDAKAGDQQVAIASKSNIGSLGLTAPNPTLKLDVTGVELKPYVTAPSMSIVTKGKGTQPPQDTQVEATVRFRIEAKFL